MGEHPQMGGEILLNGDPDEENLGSWHKSTCSDQFCDQLVASWGRSRFHSRLFPGH